jgi:comEA protein
MINSARYLAALVRGGYEWTEDESDALLSPSASLFSVLGAETLTIRSVHVYIAAKHRPEVLAPLADQLERYRWLVIALLSVPLLSGTAYLLSERLDDPAELQITSTDLPTDIRIYISGAVEHPGVYPAQEGDRWIDALEAAGGPALDADLNAVNLSRRVHDEDQIFVPRLGGTDVAGASQEPLVNINTADQAELESLPGIGEVRANSILQSRVSEGPFNSIDDLVARKVIPESVLAEIAPLISVSQ